MKKILLTDTGRSTNALISYMKKISGRNIGNTALAITAEKPAKQKCGIYNCKQPVKNEGKSL